MYALGFVTVVLIWRGIWDLTAQVISPWTSLIIGLALVVGIAIVRQDSFKSCFDLKNV
jgi:hypothetical protein